MLSFRVLLVLTITLLGINCEQFYCPTNEPFCFWIRKATTNWVTAYEDCTLTGGSLISSVHSAYIEEWMSNMDDPIPDRKVWASLHRINHRFQWFNHKPEFQQIAASEWMPGHPLLQQTTQRDCVVANHRMLYESVNCNDSFAIICAISTNRKHELNNLVFPTQGISQVQLTTDPKKFKVQDKTNHLEVDRKNSNNLLMLKCNVTYFGARKLEYSWLKDGVYLEYSNRDLIPSGVNDKSKPISGGGKFAIFQKQGTYQCQVREFGTVQWATSNAIIVTYRRILNGIVSLWPTDANNFANNQEIMEQVTNFVQQEVMKEYFKFANTETSWDPLYSLTGPDGFEIRNSFYVDIPQEYQDGTVHHMLDVISEKVGSFLQDSSVVRKIHLAWATYCPRQNETINQPPSSSFQMQWPSSWSSSNIIHPNNVNMWCLQDNNGAEPLTRLCLPDFTNGASFTSLNQKKCQQLIAKPEVRCQHGYQWMETMQLCFKITETGSWNETMASCVNEWPADDMDGVDNTTHFAVLTRLQAEKQLNELWFPIRRVSTYGPLLYYSASVNYGPVGLNSLKGMENWTGLLDEECLVQNKDGSRQLSDCSNRSIPAVCVYRPKHTGSLTLTNLCPPFWHGFRINQGRLICYSLIKSVLPMNWYAAEEKCRRENFGISAHVSIATFEDQGKDQQWNIVRSKLNLVIRSAWIGLLWSENYRKFCWFNSANNCSFAYLNWHSPINWNDGQFGFMNELGSWDLLPSSSELHEVLCQAEIDLTISQDISVRQYPNDMINVDIVQHVHQTYPTAQWFKDLTEFFSNSWRPSFPVVRIGNNVKCYVDGELIQTIEMFPATFSLHPSYNVARTFNCEGWLGWPRRFIRTEPTVVLRPPNSFIYVLLLDVVNFELQVKHGVKMVFEPEPLDDVTKRLSSLSSYGANVKVTGHRWWNFGEGTRMLVRTVLTSRPGRQQQNWTKLMKEVILLPPNGTAQISYNIVDIRSGDVCEQDSSTSLLTNWAISWNTIPVGFTSETSDLCLTQKGQPLLRKCLGNPNTGAFWEPLTDQSVSVTNTSCEQETDLFKTLKKLTDQVIADTIYPTNALEKLAGLTEWTRNKVTGFEIGQAARLLRASTERIQQLSEQQFYYTSQTLTAILASPGQLELAQSLPGISNDLVASLEYVMGNVAIPDGELGVAFHHPKMATECLLDIEKVVGYGANVDKNNLEILDGTRILHNDTEDSLVKHVSQRDIAIILPIDEIRQREGVDDSTNLRLSFSVFPNADLFDARPVTSLLANGISTNFVVDSAVIVAQVGSSTISNLNQSVRIFFRSRSQHNLSIVPVCVFWDISSMSTGWSPFGCQYVGRSQDLYICECNHLTPLALLFPYFNGDDKIDYGHHQALSVISLIGCVLSMVGLSLVLLTFLLFKKWRKSLGNKILFNFSLALFCVTTSFLCAGYVTYDPLLCKAAAAVMHYFLIASFAWMVVEGIYQYLNYVIVIGAKNYKSWFMRKAGPLAWGLPILPVLGVVIYDSQLYILKDDFCWIQLDAFYVAVLAPISMIILFNLLIFVGVLKSVVCVRLRRGIRTSQPVKTRTWYQFRMAICIFFLLGLAWMFGFVSVGDARLVFAYLFCIFHSLQGFVIFLFFVLKEKKARKLWFEFIDIDKLTTTSKALILSRSSPPTSRNSHEHENVF